MVRSTYGQLMSCSNCHNQNMTFAIILDSAIYSLSVVLVSAIKVFFWFTHKITTNNHKEVTKCGYTQGVFISLPFHI
jgi:hypothetical protein